MPEISGKEIYKKLKKNKSDLKVLFMSGYNEEVVGNHNISMDQKSFIQKPFTMNELINKVRDVIGQTTE